MIDAFDVRTALLMGGLTHLITPLAVWAVLRARHNRRSLALWSIGSALSGLGFCLIAMRDFAADWLSIGVANLVVYIGVSYRGRALLLEAGDAIQRVHTRWPYAAFLCFCASWAANEQARVTVNTAILGIATLWTAYLSMRVARAQDSRSAGFLSWALGIFGAGALVRATVLLIATPPTGHSVVFDRSAVFLVWITMGLITGLYTNVGFIGIGFESARRRELQQTAALARQQLLREQAEQHTVELTQRLGREEEVLRLLAHEVRQPLHNAMAVLQGARSGLQQATDPQTVTQRIHRAEQVIHQIVGTLDNTLAATALLASQLPVAKHDADIDMLVSMSIADLPQTAQARVHISRETGTRTAALDPSLMRLALRNLLANACTYTEGPVRLHLSDQDDPLALVIEVRDEGAGIEPAMRAHLFDAGARGQHGLPGHGLGLYVVRRVMELHGGSVQWLPNRPQGTTFRLVLPQGQD